MQLAFDSEGIALTSTMGFIKNPVSSCRGYGHAPFSRSAVADAIIVLPQISTVNMGLAVGWSCVVLSFGKKGWRKSLPHSLGEPPGGLLDRDA